MFSAVLGTGFLLYLFDEDIKDWMDRNSGALSRRISPYVNALGGGIFLSGFLGTLYAVGEVTGKDGLRHTALMGLEGWLTSGFVVMGIKILSGRARPLTGHGPSVFRPLAFSSRFNSFPSGHAASAFGVASVIAETSDSLIVDISAYSLAALVALARVHDNKHWASDVFFGSAIGYFVGKKVVALHRSRRTKAGLCLGLGVDPVRRGIILSCTF